MAKMTDVSDLKHLGSSADNNPHAYEFDEPKAEILEVFETPSRSEMNPSGADLLVNLTVNEFSSRCLTGDTLIDVARDETLHKSGIPIKDLVGTEGYVYSFDPVEGKPVVKRYTDVRVTAKDDDVYLVRLEKLHNNGKGEITRIPVELKCTATHPILVRVGWGKYDWVEAQNLRPGMRLVSDQINHDAECSDVIRGFSRSRLLASAILDRDLTDSEHVHHIDHNHYNNSPQNLMILNESDHIKYHRSVDYIHADIDLQELESLYVSQGKSVDACAKHFDVDNSTIINRLNRLQVLQRSQSEQIMLNARIQNESLWHECRSLYEKGYTTYELAEYFQKHAVTICEWVRLAGGEPREANESRALRKSVDLAPLNHCVLGVEYLGKEDVYNMEVEDTECFFANGVVVHNCPKTGQPDFATIMIDYVPDEKCVESKSVKLYMGAFRDFGEFHESCVIRIMNDMVEVMQPKWIRVVGFFTPRGGFPIIPTAVHAKEGYQLPADLKQRLMNSPQFNFRY